ncbi:unnamed protein product [Fraxinus pennsylvanica]|uniref:Uncharacterized protein n=1 Tax=Fraxinus pennsylvanica TaxID=56036 RepID=A0AAD2AIY8_9LAMI|nr:unnamed protein product [Fraxinus pennsylvanica]
MWTPGSSASKKLDNVVEHNPGDQMLSVESSLLSSDSPQQQQFPPPAAASRQFRPVTMELGCGSSFSQSFSPAKAGLATEILGNEISAEVGKLIPDFLKLAEKLEEKLTVPKEAQAKKPKLYSRRSTKNTVESIAEKKGKPLVVFKDEVKGKQLASKDWKRKKTLLTKVENDKPVGIRGAEDDEGNKKWNLRDRKAIQLPKTAILNPRAGSSSNAVRVAGESGERNMKEKQDDISTFPKLPNFSLQLTTEEIALDMLVMTGKMPSRKPKKRLKSVQRDLNVANNYST